MLAACPLPVSEAAAPHRPRQLAMELIRAVSLHDMQRSLPVLVNQIARTLRDRSTVNAARTLSDAALFVGLTHALAHPACGSKDFSTVTLRLHGGFAPLNARYTCDTDAVMLKITDGTASLYAGRMPAYERWRDNGECLTCRGVLSDGTEVLLPF